MRHVLSVLIMMVCQMTFSQASMKVYSIDAGGGRFNSGTTTVVSTIGEVVIQEHSVNTLEVSEGFINTSLYAQGPQNPNCISPPNNLISLWAAEDDASDAFGANHGTPLSGVSYTTGVVNKVFLFDGVDDVVVVPHSGDLDITGDMTLELWVRRIGYANKSQTVICKGAGYVPLDEPAVFAMRFENDLTEFLFEDINGNNIIVNGPAYEDSQWHHYAYVRQGNQHIVYADGFDFGWTSFAEAPESSLGLPLTIGAQYHNPTNAAYDYDNFFHGEVDEVSVYNRALSQEEIQNIFNAGGDGKCRETLNLEEDLITEHTIKIYPNPVEDELNIDFYEQKGFKVTLVDINGNVLSSYNNTSRIMKINMRNKASGMYFLTVQNQENYQSKAFKVIKR